jgi:hypothetical protein
MMNKLYVVQAYEEYLGLWTMCINSVFYNEHEAVRDMKDWEESNEDTKYRVCVVEVPND